MRHLRPLCKQCVYWMTENTSDQPVSGHCHRFPPGIFIKPDTGVVVQKFPTTDHQQWCGEWTDDDSHLVDAVKRSLVNRTAAR